MQFTLRRLLLSTAIVALGIAGGVLPWRLTNEEFYRFPGVVQGVLLCWCWSCLAIVCGGIGWLFNRPIGGVVVGYLLTFISFVVAGIMFRV